MPVTLDLSTLETPPAHGRVLIAPAYSSFEALVVSNRTLAQRYAFQVNGVPFEQYRGTVREALGLRSDQPVIAVGHQPEFFHCGVWAKNVVCSMLADQLGAVGVNAVIDHDKVGSTHLQVPHAESGRVRVAYVLVHLRSAAQVWEQLPAWSDADIERFSSELDEVPGMAGRSSLMPNLLQQFAACRAPRDWVSQFIFATKVIDRTFGISLQYARASEIDYGCFFADLIVSAHRFASSYNSALHTYREQYRIKGTRHPIPDLYMDQDRAELPIWITDPQGQRHRLIVARDNDRFLIYADDRLLESYAKAELSSWDRARVRMDELTTTYQLRPRALTFTIWARLFLSDLFVHGIGGAKYDRIADLIIRDYYEVEPPRFCCVSATMWLNFPRYEVQRSDLLYLRRQLRDSRYNPQRYVADQDAVGDLIARREQLVCESDRLRRESPGDRSARRQAFQGIHSANRRLQEYCVGQLQEMRERRSTLDWQLKSDSLAGSREYFYGLFSRKTLQALQNQLRAADGD